MFDTDNCLIWVRRLNDAKHHYAGSWSKDKTEIAWSKYQIKETDFRVKTASFVSPINIDLTTGQYLVLISSIYHENFSGVILSKEFDEETGMYTYQCQDFSRRYMGSVELVLESGKRTVHDVLKWLIISGAVDINSISKSSVRKDWKEVLSGLHDIELYNQALYPGNTLNINPMKNKPKMIIRNKSEIETIRDLAFGTLRYVDVWFNDNGIIQIDPLSRTDWMNTGLVLGDSDFIERTLKFDTTNAITGVQLEGSGTSMGTGKSSESLVGLDLAAFFGGIVTSVSSNATSNATSNTTSVGKNGNPFNNKKKKIIVSADRGSNAEAFKGSIISKLKKDGWTVVDTGTAAPSKHSIAYNKIDSSYAVDLIITNGMCAGSIREVFDNGSVKSKHKKCGVEPVLMFDTDQWTEKTGKHNKKGIWYHRNGDMSDFDLWRAWDDNFSRGDPRIRDVEKYFIQNKVAYCCGTTPEAAYNQFKAGGYLRMKNLI